MTTNSEVKELAAMVDSMNEAQLNFIANRVKRRYTALREERVVEVLSTLKVGDRVELQHIKPKYFEGHTGTVVAVDSERVTVNLDWMPRSTKRWANPLKVFPSSVKLLS